MKRSGLSGKKEISCKERDKMILYIVWEFCYDLREYERFKRENHRYFIEELYGLL